MSDALLRFENVTKSYGDFTVFSDISLEVHEKEVVSIIGSSGSGKTTLLRCINLLEPFEAGKIILDGQEIGYHAVNGKRKRVPEKVIAQQRSMTGMVFQQFNLFPHMTAKKNVMLGLTHTKKMPKAEAEALAEKWLTAVGLGDKMDNLPSELSGGQQQRVAIARAVAMNPKILLFDEATSALDTELVGEELNVIRSLAKEGATMMPWAHRRRSSRSARRHDCANFCPHSPHPSSRAMQRRTEPWQKVFTNRSASAQSLMPGARSRRWAARSWRPRCCRPCSQRPAPSWT